LIFVESERELVQSNIGTENRKTKRSKNKLIHINLLKNN